MRLKVCVDKHDPVYYTAREFYKTYGEDPEIVASAPGRLDFLNTHQDYKGLPVVSIAINMRTYVAVSRSRDKSSSTVVSLNLCSEGSDCRDVFDPHAPILLEKGWFGNYIRSVVRTLMVHGMKVDPFNMLIYSEVPIASGLASSAALQVAAVKALTTLNGLSLEPLRVAELAYISEHDVMGIPCGRLDQYGSALGGITIIETRPPYKTKTFKTSWFRLVAIDTGIKHSTGMIHPVRIKEILTGLQSIISLDDIPHELKRKIALDVYHTKWDEISYEEISPYLNRIDEVSRRRIEFTLKMHYSTMLALRFLENPTGELRKTITDYLSKECSNCLEEADSATRDELRLLGAIVNYQHYLLRDLYDVSLPVIEEIRRRALDCGAIAVKISGAGLGGSLLAIVEDENKGLEVIKGIRDLARKAWIVEIDEGVRVEKSN